LIEVTDAQEIIIDLEKQKTNGSESITDITRHLIKFRIHIEVIMIMLQIERT